MVIPAFLRDLLDIAVRSAMVSIENGERFMVLRDAAESENETLRRLLGRIVKYATEDKAQTPGFTRLARVIEEARDILAAKEVGK
mgnify:CR=1 FL=1